MKHTVMRQLLGWGVALIVIGLVLGVLAVTGVIVAAGLLPWLAGLALIVGIILAIASAAAPRERRGTRA